MKDKAFMSLVGAFFILFVAAIGVIVMNNPTSNVLRAKNSVPSPLKSFVIVFPQVGVAGDVNSSKTPTKIKVSVFLRDVSGNVMPDRSVKITTNPTSAAISPTDTAFTNNIGMAEFSLSSNVAGQVALNATDVASNMSISNIPTLEFTE